jgi:hypothetical protein
MEQDALLGRHGAEALSPTTPEELNPADSAVRICELTTASEADEKQNVS